MSGLPLTTGAGNTAGRIVAEGDVHKVEPTRQYFAELRASLKNGLDASRDLDDSVEDLRYSLASAEAECGRLREQLDAAEQTFAWLEMALGWAVFRDDSRVWGSNEMRDIEERVRAAAAAARAALGVEGPAG